MAEAPTIFLAGGGTGGHLYPGVAVAQALRQRIPEAKLLFLCTTREIDRVILEPTGFEFIPQPIVPPVRSIGGLLRFWRSWRETKDLLRKLLRERKPDAVLGLGGYAAGVAVKMAAVRKIPVAILNPDVLPGRANHYLLRYVKAVCCQFRETADHIPSSQRSKIHVTGCPIRQDILSLPDRGAAAGRLGLHARLMTLVVTGASQGAQTINQAVLSMIPTLKLQGWQILHLAGREHAQEVRDGYRELSVPARVVDFTPAMQDVWAVADLAIARAGASTCAELCACGVPSILMPYPFHRDMHQRANAQVLANSGAAIVVDDAKDPKQNAERLAPVLESLLYDAPRRQCMSDAARRLAHPDAADNVASIITDFVASRR